MNYAFLIFDICIILIIGITNIYIYSRLSYKDNLLNKLFIHKNDSIWEHIKTLFTPILIITLFEILLGVGSNFVLGKLLSLVLMALINPIVFLLLFNHSTWDMIKINITNIVITLLIGIIPMILMTSLIELNSFVYIISIIGLVLILIFYITATFFPTNDFIFIDPETKKVKIKKDE